jgi:hypothetical protein
VGVGCRRETYSSATSRSQLMEQFMEIKLTLTNLQALINSLKNAFGASTNNWVANKVVMQMIHVSRRNIDN